MKYALLVLALLAGCRESTAPAKPPCVQRVDTLYATVIDSAGNYLPGIRVIIKQPCNGEIVVR